MRNWNTILNSTQGLTYEELMIEFKSIIRSFVEANIKLLENQIDNIIDNTSTYFFNNANTSRGTDYKVKFAEAFTNDDFIRLIDKLLFSEVHDMVNINSVALSVFLDTLFPLITKYKENGFNVNVYVDIDEKNLEVRYHFEVSLNFGK